MFKKQLMGFIFVWLTLILGCFSFLQVSSSDSKMTYENLINYGSQFKKDEMQEGNRSTQQTRHHVSKQILYQKGPHRMQSRLVSDYSDLNYSKKQGELVECFKTLTCIMQEELIHDSNSEGQDALAPLPLQATQQMIRQFQAKAAVYSYKSGQLEADEVGIAHYLVPGDLWPDSFDRVQSLFQGQATTIHLSLFKEPALQAYGFHAVFHDCGG